MQDTPPRPVLSRLERRLLRLLGEGLTQREAAEKLSYSPEYVREVLSSARGKLGSRTTAQAVGRATRAGLI